MQQWRFLGAANINLKDGRYLVKKDRTRGQKKSENRGGRPWKEGEGLNRAKTENYSGGATYRIHKKVLIQLPIQKGIPKPEGGKERGKGRKRTKLKDCWGEKGSELRTLGL